MSGAQLQQSRDSQTLEHGAMFGRYRINRLLGAGGMGAVYEAQHVELNKIVALKTLSSNSNGWVRLLNEGEAAARIRHRNVVDVYDVGAQDGTVFLVMEYLEGEDLRMYLDRGRTFDHAQLAKLVLPLCAALQAAHRQGVVHRDVKPSNVFLAQGAFEEMTPKLLDFGISKLVDQKTRDGEFGTGLLVGTLPYMAPEQALGERAGGRIDQYSMGVMIYRMSTGRLPFADGASIHELLVQVSRGMYVPPREAFPEIDPRLEALIIKAMALEPSDRFDSMLDMGKALLPLADARTADEWRSVFGGTVDKSTMTQYPARAAADIASEASLVTPAPDASDAGAGDVEDDAPASASSGSGSQSFGGGHVMYRRTWVPVLGAWGVALALGVGVLVGSRAFQPGRWTLPGAATTLSDELVKTDGLPFAPDEPPLLSAKKPPLPAANEPPPLALEPLPVVDDATVEPVGPPQTRSAAETKSYDVRVVTTPRGAKIEVDGQVVGRGQMERTYRLDNARHVLTVSAPGYRRKRITFVDRPPPPVVVLKRVVKKRVGPKVAPTKASPPPKPPVDTGPNDSLILP